MIRLALTLVLLAAPVHAATLNGWQADSPTILRPADTSRLRSVDQFTAAPGAVNMNGGIARMTITGEGLTSASISTLDLGDVFGLEASARVRIGDRTFRVGHQASGTENLFTHSFAPRDSVTVTVRSGLTAEQNDGATFSCPVTTRLRKKGAR